jgi:hypothetical protein
MVYPFEYYNLVGNKGVVGFSANNLAIDASNFGIYPVFVFSENGIYAMELGTGEVLVTRIVPLSGDVCTDKGSITNIGGATLFASREGLRILQGQQSQLITALLENYRSNPLKDNRHFNAILGKYGFDGLTSDYAGGFEEFLDGVKCYLNYTEKEVVMTNERYPYSYVLGLASKLFYKTGERFYNVFNDYPHAYGTSEDGKVIYEVGAKLFPEEKQKVFVQTNAFKLGTDEFERLRRLIVRMRLTDGQMGAYLFVSNDTRKWAWVDGKEVTGSATNFNYLSCPGSVKYGMLVLAGEMDIVRDFMTHVSTEWEKRFEGKVR